jgi:spore germination protein
MKKVLRSLSQYKLVWVVLLCMVALLFFSAATTQAAPQTTCGVYHFVQRGETLYSISRQYGVLMMDIMRANGIRNADRIYAGTYLYIPCGNSGPGGPGVPGGPGCRHVHYVQWGQTLNEIALYYRVHPHAIARVNGIYNLDLIYAGETLCIP